MLHSDPSKSTLIVTTSWDDGDPLDLKLAELLERYRIKGTFYVPIAYGSKVILNDPDLRLLHSVGMEIGAHTLTHPDLDAISESETVHELSMSKVILEERLSHPVTSFCYPKGIYTAAAKRSARDLGYTLARTTVSLHTNRSADPFLLPVTLQLYPHSSFTYLRSAVKRMNIHGISTLRHLMHAPRIIDKVRILAAMAYREQGIVHLWGHSWELEEFQLWGQLEDCLKMLNDTYPSVTSVTNRDLLQVLQ